MEISSSTNNKDLIERLNRHPILKKRLESILSIVENTNGSLKKADDAEKQAIIELRQLGNEVMHTWAEQRIEQSVDALLYNENEVLESKSKKK